MKRTNVNFLVDALALVALVFLAATGAIIRYVLPGVTSTSGLPSPSVWPWSCTSCFIGDGSLAWCDGIRAVDRKVALCWC
jgi:hypothetical protein